MIIHVDQGVSRVIRNRAGLYYKRGGEWTDYLPDAEKFPNIQAAVAVQERRHLTSVDLVFMVYGDKPSPEWDVVFPMSGSHKS